MITKRQWVAIAVLLVTTAGVWRYSLVQSATGPKQLYAKRIPSKLGDWTGADRLVDATAIAVLRTSDVLEREYRRADDPPVHLTVVFAMDDRQAVHAPEECEVGAGGQIFHRVVAKYPVRLPRAHPEPDPVTGELPADMQLGDTIDLEVIEMGLDTPNGRKLLHFFYKSGQRTTANYLQHEIDMLMSSIKRGTSTNSLVKLTTPIVPPATDRDFDEARGRLREMMAALFPYVMAALP